MEVEASRQLLRTLRPWEPPPTNYVNWTETMFLLNIVYLLMWHVCCSQFEFAQIQDEWKASTDQSPANLVLPAPPWPPPWLWRSSDLWILAGFERGSSVCSVCPVDCTGYCCCSGAQEWSHPASPLLKDKEWQSVPWIQHACKALVWEKRTLHVLLLRQTQWQRRARM